MMIIKVRQMDCHFRVSVGITANVPSIAEGGGFIAQKPTKSTTAEHSTNVH
jgi:hypothetical protein